MSEFRASKLTPETPVTVDVVHDECGGVAVTVNVPTYAGGMKINVTVERDADGDWRISIPWPDDLDENTEWEIPLSPDGFEVSHNGLIYVGAPDEAYEQNWKAMG